MKKNPKAGDFVEILIFWDYLKDQAINLGLISSNDLEEWIKKEHFKLSGQEMTVESMAFVEEFAHGGMSSGGISCSWWIETGISLLKSRL